MNLRNIFLKGFLGPKMRFSREIERKQASRRGPNRGNWVTKEVFLWVDPEFQGGTIKCIDNQPALRLETVMLGELEGCRPGIRASIFTHSSR